MPQTLLGLCEWSTTKKKTCHTSLTSAFGMVSIEFYLARSYCELTECETSSQTNRSGYKRQCINRRQKSVRWWVLWHLSLHLAVSTDKQDTHLNVCCQTRNLRSSSSPPCKRLRLLQPACLRHAIASMVVVYLHTDREFNCTSTPCICNDTD